MFFTPLKAWARRTPVRWAAGAMLVILVAAGAVWAWPWLRVTGYLNEARQALRRGEPEAALVPLAKAVRVQPDRAAVQYLLAVAKRRAGRIDESAIHLARAAELGWPEQDIHRQRWLATAQRGDLPEVKKTLLQTIDSGANDEAAEEIYEAFAMGCLCTYRLQDAWMCLDIWLQWQPDAPQARIMRALVYEQIGQLENAMEDYRAVLAQLPQHRQARIRLGQVLLESKRYDEAMAEFQARLAVAPEDPEALLGAARCARRLGNTAEAKQLLETALPLAESGYQRGMILGELGRVLLSEGKPHEALDCLTQALPLIPGESSLHHALGTALARTGNREQAQYHLARLQHAQDQFKRMTEIVRRLTLEPDNADLRCQAGEVLIDAGLRKEGADWLLTALKCDPAHRKTHELLAEYYAEIGDQSRAGYHRLKAAESPPPKTASAERSR